MDEAEPPAPEAGKAILVGGSGVADEALAADANEADGGRHKSRSASRTARSHSREQGGQGGEVHQEPREGRGERERVREGRTPRRQPSDLETGPAK